MSAAPGDEPIERHDAGEGSRERSFLRPASHEEMQAVLQRQLRELQAKGGNLTPKERARLALLIEFCVEDD